MNNDFKNLALSIIHNPELENEFGEEAAVNFCTFDEHAEDVSRKIFGTTLDSYQLADAMVDFKGVSLAVALASPDGYFEDMAFFNAAKAIQKYWPEELAALGYPLAGTRIREIVNAVSEDLVEEAEEDDECEGCCHCGVYSVPATPPCYTAEDDGSCAGVEGEVFCNGCALHG